MATVDHDASVVSWTSLRDGGGGTLDVLGGKVGTFASATENDMDVLVAPGLDDGGQSLLRNTHERVGVRG